MAYTTIDDPTIYFNTKLYTGNGGTNAITGVGFQPDWVWIKDRDTSQHQRLADVVRGVKKNLKSDQTDAENTTDSNNGLQSFDSDGFTLTQDSNDHGYNASGSSQVSWNWKAGGSASSNTDGSITSSVSVSTDAGFSIVSYTGTGSSATVGHGLGAVPSVMIFKNRIDTTNWVVYHHKNTSAPETDYLYLNRTNATSDYQHHFNDTAPTSSVFTLGYDNGVNDSSDAMIAYCFSEIKGYSKFGSYTGNGGSQNFIYTGFKPAWIIGKRTDVTNNYYMFDNKRNTFNVTDAKLRADQSSAENVNSGKTIDFISNGVNIKSSDEEFNASGGTYIFMAFAESPLVNSKGVPNNAR